MNGNEQLIAAMAKLRGLIRNLELRSLDQAQEMNSLRTEIARLRDLVGTMTVRRDEEKERRPGQRHQLFGSSNGPAALLPVCASCKQIRDDEGCWHQAENYFRIHARVAFTHGYCPSCESRLLKELESVNCQEVFSTIV